MRTVRKIAIEGFKSFEKAEIDLQDLNVLIGANGSGKSNFISVFRLLEQIASETLLLDVAGDPDRLLYHGRKKTKELSLEFDFDEFAYRVILAPVRDKLVFKREVVLDSDRSMISRGVADSRPRSLLDSEASNRSSPFVSKTLDKVRGSARNLVLYHFEDTSEGSPARQMCDVEDNRYFRPDAANLPAYLYLLKAKHETHFRRIEEHVRLVAPFFDRFDLAPSALNHRKIELVWRQKNSEAHFDAYSLSDGTLRFICLATLMLQPAPPGLILIDEPELGLHPFAIRILAEMIEAAATRTQVILATQSVTLLDNFLPENIIVAENDGLKTTLSRLDKKLLEEWLGEFSLGELWEKNVLGGRP
jgi:predicted ATPase